jgi:hypothetical protein
MIRSVVFQNFRNIKYKKFIFNDKLNIIIGKNNSGKTNILEGIKLAFSAINNSYMKVSKSDFYKGDDTKPIEIILELDKDSIPSFNIPLPNGTEKCGFKVVIKKAPRGRYIKEFFDIEGNTVSRDVVYADDKVPDVYMIPLMRIEDIVSPGLITGVKNLLDSEEAYETFRRSSQEGIKKQISGKAERFKYLVKRFNFDLDIDSTVPEISNEKLYVVDSEDTAYKHKIGSGYRAIANILLNTLSQKNTIILLDEIENHLHPALLRNLISEMKSEAFRNVFILATTHSPVAVNEFKVERIIDSTKGSISDLIISEDILNKLNAFLCPSRGEMLVADNIVLVEGYSEEILLRKYVSDKKLNWTIVNVAGIMFEPYVILARALDKKCVVASDNDRAQSDNGKEPTSRFKNLRKLCEQHEAAIIEVDNTLETDLYDNGKLSEYTNYLKPHTNHTGIMVMKDSKSKASFALEVVGKVDLSDWHVIKEITNAFEEGD